MNTKEFHEYYKKMLEEMFSDEFKKCMLEAEVSTFGEEKRQILEANMARIIIHPKVALLNPDLNDKRKPEQQSKYEKQARKEKDAEKQQKDDEKQQKDDELDEFLNAISMLSLDQLFGQSEKEDGMQEKSKNDELLQQSALLFDVDKLETDTAVKENDIELSKYTNYYELCKELEDYDLSNLDLKNEFLEYATGSLVIELKNKNSGKYEYHIFLNPLANRDSLYHTGAHEILHASEYTTREINGEIRFNTGHNTFEDDSNRYTRLAETLHDFILLSEIQPVLKEKGYECSCYSSYFTANFDAMYRFYTTFRKEIIRTACQEDNIELTEIIGLENWNHLADIVGYMGDLAKEQLEDVVNAMIEYSKEHLAERIGRDTIMEQRDVVAKDQVAHELHEVIEMQKDLTATHNDVER